MNFALVFPGQGSQSVGMMGAYGDSAVIRSTFDEASQALGRDLWQLVCEGPAEALAQTVNTQPLMLTAGIAVYRQWLDKGGREPSVVAGHSLGEYSALVAAGVLAFADAVPLVEFRAKAMQEAVPTGEGAMAALLGLDADVVREACLEAAQGECVEAVNLNAPGQIVIAGHASAVARANEVAKARGAKRAVMLPVSAPFHSALMKPAADALAGRLASVQLNKPAIPVVNNVDVARYDDPEQIRDALVRQACNPVRWIEIMQAFGNLGVTQVYECGPGKVLSGMTKRCDGRLAGGAFSDAATLEAALAVVAG
ncbi:MAG: ACP S-malonyltransferase [Rhodocyclaceae bacterium]|nr:ACP S-malonyltransferase [Rhodocyclaceae bacterium]